MSQNQNHIDPAQDKEEVRTFSKAQLSNAMIKAVEAALKRQAQVYESRIQSMVNNKTPSVDPTTTSAIKKGERIVNKAQLGPAMATRSATVDVPYEIWRQPDAIKALTHTAVMEQLIELNNRVHDRNQRIINEFNQQTDLLYVVERENDELTYKYNDLKRDNATTTEVNAALERQIQECESEIKSLYKTIAHVEAESRSEVQVYKAKIQSLETYLHAAHLQATSSSEYESKTKALETTIARLEAKLRSHEGDQAALVVLKDQFSTAVANKVASKLQSDVESIKTTLGTSTAVQNAFADAQSAFANKHTEVLQNVHATVHDVQAKVNDVQTTVHDIQGDAIALSRELEELNNEMLKDAA